MMRITEGDLQKKRRGIKPEASYLPPPIKGLVHVITKAVIAEYYQEQLQGQEKKDDHEGSPLRAL